MKKKQTEAGKTKLEDIVKQAHKLGARVSITLTPKPWAYGIEWQQRMGASRGITCRVATECWETAKLVWTQMCETAMEDTVREVKCYVDRADSKGRQQFDPEGAWPKLLL